MEEFAWPLAPQGIYSVFKGNPEDNLPLLQTPQLKLFYLASLVIISLFAGKPINTNNEIECASASKLKKTKNKNNTIDKVPQNYTEVQGCNSAPACSLALYDWNEAK